MPIITPGKTNWTYIIIVLILAIIAGGIWVWQLYFEEESCLTENEFADWSFSEWWAKRIKNPEAVPIIYVKDKNTNQVKFSLQIEDVMDSGYPLEVHRC